MQGQIWRAEKTPLEILYIAPYAGDVEADVVTNITGYATNGVIANMIATGRVPPGGSQCADWAQVKGEPAKARKRVIRIFRGMRFTSSCPC